MKNIFFGLGGETAQMLTIWEGVPRSIDNDWEITEEILGGIKLTIPTPDFVGFCLGLAGFLLHIQHPTFTADQVDFHFGTNSPLPPCSTQSTL